MKFLFWPLAALLALSFSQPLLAQTATGVTSLLDYSGDYGTKDSTLFSIVKTGNQLFVSTSYYGKIRMIPLPDHRFQLEGVRPEAYLSFQKDSTEKGMQLTVNQKGKFTFFKLPDSAGNASNPSAAPTVPALSAYTGRYRQDIDMYNIIHIIDSAGTLKNKNLNFTLTPSGKNRFKDEYSEYEFIKDKKGQVQKLVLLSSAPKTFSRRPGANGMITREEHMSSRQNGFTRADSLHGMLTAARTCYDVLFYDLNVSVEPETKSIHGNTIIRFRTVHPFDSLQIDLYANMKIEKILYHNQELPYSREYNAVFIRFPSSPLVGSAEELNIFYSGKPRLPDLSILAGGFFWVHDRQNKMWIESVCQGAGSSLWWPCKDHLSDKPDSMKISITVPTGLMDISNGRLQKVTALPGNLTRYDWYVSYPINNYNVVVNIGDYAHFTDSYISGQDTLALNFYCMPYNLGIAKKIFGNAKAMLALYEKNFGPYPFRRDGFTLMESFYAMEHQGAVSIGYLNWPFNSDKYDSAELTRTMWHESAHEWWGNSVTCSDYADFWIHESFATYAEFMAYENLAGPAAVKKYLEQNRQWVQNKEPIIGVYDVNNFHMGDMYPKGGLMLNTLRTLIGNDSLWYAILKGIQQEFRYRSITTEDIVGYINKATHKDYTPFFDQYLRHTALPELALTLEQDGANLRVQYKWKADVSAFNMPVKVTTAKDSFAYIYPTTAPQTITLLNMQKEDFKIDKDDFYIKVTTQ